MTSICAFVNILRRAIDSIAFVAIFANALVRPDRVHASSIVMTVVSSFVAFVHIRLLVCIAVVIHVTDFFLRSVKSFVSILVVVLVLVIILLLLLLFLRVWACFLSDWSASWSLSWSLSRLLSLSGSLSFLWPRCRPLRWPLRWTLWTLVLVLFLSFLLAWTSWTRLWRYFLDWPPSRLVEPLCWRTSFLAVLSVVVGIVAVDCIFVIIIISLERSSKRTGSFECRKCVFVDFKNDLFNKNFL